MPTVNLRRFSEPDALKEIAPAHLLALLEPHREFLTGRGLTLPPAGSAAELDYEKLAPLFLSPDDIPAELVEKFHLVKQMSGKDTMDHILEVAGARQREFNFAPDSSPMDVAAQLLLKAPALFHELHAERAAERHRAYTFFVARRKPALFTVPSDLKPLEKDLNQWYEHHQRGRTARVLGRQKDHEWWFYIRHAEPIKREGCVGLKDHESGSMIYRPERHDLVVYDAQAGEIRIHADCRQEPEMFRQLFGWHLFKDPDFFPRSREKYTLDPLKAVGRAALAWGGIEGVMGITLKEVEFLRPGARWERERHHSEDVFASFEERGFVIPVTAQVRLAKFAVRFSDAKKPRMVTIRPSNYALVGRDDDAVVLAPWLKRQGFTVDHEPVPEDELLGELRRAAA
jgi:hypothetical protein